MANRGIQRNPEMFCNFLQILQIFRRHQDTDKNWRKAERRVKEVEFQVEEDKKNAERLTELIDKLQTKLKVFKRQVEEAVSFCAMKTLNGS